MKIYLRTVAALALITAFAGAPAMADSGGKGGNSTETGGAGETGGKGGNSTETGGSGN